MRNTRLRPWLTTNRNYDEEDKIKVFLRKETFEQTPILQDARLPEPATADFTITKLDKHTQKMDTFQAIWIQGSRREQISKPDLETKLKIAKVPQPFGQPQYDYTTYHKETVVLLLQGKENLDALIGDFERKRSRGSKAISEKSSMVDLKSGNAQEKMIKNMTTPTAEEIGDRAFREAEADRKLERAEEMEYEEAIERARPRANLKGWRDAKWWR
jgi:hypothetical protein